MTLFAISDVVWQALIAAVVTIVLAWMSRRTQQAVSKTGDHLDKQDEKLDVLHALTNSAMGDQKRQLVIATRSNAERTGKAEDILAAQKAQQELQEHNERQALADKVDADNLRLPTTLAGK